MGTLSNRRDITEILIKGISLLALVSLFLFCVPHGLAEEDKAKKPDLPKEALKALYKAQQAFNEKNHAEAIGYLEEYLATNPPDVPVPVYMMLGHCWYEKGDREEARKAFGKGYKKYPNDPNMLLNYVVLTYETERFNEAGVLFEKLYELQEPSKPKVLFQAAVSYYQGRDLRKAKGVLARLLDLPGKPESKWYEMIISICAELEEWEEVERRVVSFLRLMPAQAKYWRLLAQIRLDKEDFRAAASALEIAYRIEPPKGKEWLNLADLYLYLNAPLMAVRCIKAGCGKSIPVKEHMRIADAYFRTQRFEKAFGYIDEAFRKEPSAKLIFEKGRMLYDTMRFEEAISVLEECVRMDPKMGEAYMLMGFAAWNLNDWEKARSAFSGASLIPDYREDALDGVAVMDDLIEESSELTESDS